MSWNSSISNAMTEFKNKITQKFNYKQFKKIYQEYGYIMWIVIL